MICGLFSSFDPTILNSLYFPKWPFILVIFIFLLQVSSFWGVGSFFLKFYQFIYSFTGSSFKFYKNPIILSGSLFYLILMMNIMGLVPFFFSFSSHLSVNLSLSLCLWLGSMIYSALTSSKKLIAHLVPLGSPPLLWPLLVLVESVSMIIRPLTLAIRLMANVMAGHLIMSLLSMGFSKMLVFFMPAIVLMAGFIFFEICIGLIQAYVFVSLLVLYWSE